MKDRIKPDWRTAKAHFDRAIDLLGSREAGNWPFYELNRAMCSIQLDANFAAAKPADAATRKAIVQDLRTARRGLADFGAILEQPHNVDLRKWLQLNGAPRLD